MRILVAEDEKDLNRLISGKLTKEGYATDSCFDGQDAPDHCKAPADGVYFEKAKLERDDGRTYYEIEFKFGTAEYEYDIDALTGEIISFDSGTND